MSQPVHISEPMAGLVAHLNRHRPPGATPITLDGPAEEQPEGAPQ